jgi:hypothetical protein
MREWILVLAAFPVYAHAQAEFPSPPPELDQMVMRNPPHVSASTIPSIAIDADYSEEARIAGLEGRVVLAGTKVIESLGLGLDERAIEAAQKGDTGGFALEPRFLHADFLLPMKNSRWHLLSVAFVPPEGASRPVFASASYPQGAGLIGGQAIDYAQSVATTGRRVLLALAIDIDERGIPVHFSTLYTTDDLWASQAVEFIRDWRFQPARLEGKAVPAHCAIGLTWGPKILSADQIVERNALIRTKLFFPLR